MRYIHAIRTSVFILSAIGSLAGCTSVQRAEKTLHVSPLVQRIRSERVVYSAFDAATTQNPGILDLFVMEADGSHQRNLTKSRAGEADPALSPDGSLIAYTVYADEKPGTEGIYVMQVDGSTRRRVTPISMVACAPQWSSDGKQLAFCSVTWTANNRGGSDPTWRIYRIDLDGKNLRFLCEGWLPSWSPDGKSLLYTQIEGNSGKASLHIRSLKSKEDRSLTSPQDPLLSVNGVFSPDGSQIAFVGAGEEISAIWIMKADGSEKRRITAGKYKDYAPQWSAEGKHLYFTRAGEGVTLSGIWVMDLSGANPQLLTSGGKAFSDAGFAFPTISFMAIGTQ